ncbi:hypothetical protein ABTK18_19320, partial [Acinetobacter baumannii]
GILTAAPDELLDHPQVKAAKTGDEMRGAKDLAREVDKTCQAFVKAVEDRLGRWKAMSPDLTRQISETTRNYSMYIREFGHGCSLLTQPQGV